MSAPIYIESFEYQLFVGSSLLLLLRGIIMQKKLECAICEL